MHFFYYFGDFCFAFFRQGSLYSHGCLGTRSVDQAVPAYPYLSLLSVRTEGISNYHQASLVKFKVSI